MTQISRPWSGTTVGDSGPYSDNQWADTRRSDLVPTDALPDDAGVLKNQLNELFVTGIVTPVSVGSGRADVQGKWYENNAAVTVVIPTPGAATRIDRIVARADYTAQTVRITRIAGVEGGAAPALVQIANTTWDIPLAQLSTTTGGAITRTDQRIKISAGAFPNLYTAVLNEMMAG